MDQETETLLRLASRTVQFATDHPYAATGIFGAMVGSAVTYKVLTLNPRQSPLNNIFTPKAYELALSSKDLQHLLDDPQAELRWETPEIAVIITSEKREALKELPVIEYNDDETPN
jgi:hypothetical protein